MLTAGTAECVMYMFDHQSGDVVDELRVDPHEWVQTVAVSVLI